LLITISKHISIQDEKSQHFTGGCAVFEWDLPDRVPFLFQERNQHQENPDRPEKTQAQKLDGSGYKRLVLLGWG